MKKIGIIGLGAMGFPIAEHIAASGYPLYFFARKQDVIERAEKFGATFIPTIEELGSYAETVIILVNTFSQCVECLNKLLRGMKKGTIIIESTISHKEMEHIEKMCEPNGINVIDAPISGGVRGAVSGNLTLMAAGDKELVDSYIPLFQTYSKKIVYAGNKVGKAQILKSVNQLLVGIHTIALAEAYSLGIKSGINPKVIYETIVESAGNSKIFENRGKTIIERNFVRRSSLNIQKKDLNICEQLAAENNAPLLVGTLCKQLFELAAGKFDPEEDISAVIKIYEDMCGITEEDYC